MTGIQQFLGQVNGNVCEKYIMHLRKVIPKIIGLVGDATGYSLLFFIQS